MVEHRLDLHNAACDEAVATAGLCGTTDLRTGQVCIRPARHHGSCDFVPGATGRAVAAELRLRASSQPGPVTDLDDPARLATARRLEALHRRPSPVLDRLTVIAAELLDAPVSLLTLIDPDGQFFLSAHGLPESLRPVRRIPLDYSICQYAVVTGAPYIVTDTSREPRLADNRAVTELGVAAYAGIPVVHSTRLVLGALCVIDFVCRDWRDDQLTLLDTLANLCSAELTREGVAPEGTGSMTAAAGASGTEERSLVW